MELHYEDKLHKLIVSKKQAQDEGIAVWEVEDCLDTDLFLDEYPWWEDGGPQCSFLLQNMFMDAKRIGQKEMELVICWGCWQALPRLDAKADVPAIQLMGFKTTQREIQELYNDICQLKRLPDPPPCGPEWAEELAQEIVTS